MRTYSFYAKMYDGQDYNEVLLSITAKTKRRAFATLRRHGISSIRYAGYN